MDGEQDAQKRTPSYLVERAVIGSGEKARLQGRVSPPHPAEHVLGEHRRTAHTLTPWAEVIDGKELLYPPDR
jgi:hypothetical protein